MSADGDLGSYTNTSFAPVNLIISGGTLAASASFALNPSRTIAVGAPGSLAGTISVASTATLTYNGAIAGYTTSGPSGTGGLTLTGGGTLALGGANTYTGPTTVSQGTLSLANGGSLSASSAVTVSAGGTLAGSGTANGSVAISGTIAPGTPTTVGTLNVGSLTLNGGGSYTWKLSSATGNPGSGYDTVNVAGGADAEYQRRFGQPIRDQRERRPQRRDVRQYASLFVDDCIHKQHHRRRSIPIFLRSIRRSAAFQARFLPSRAAGPTIWFSTTIPVRLRSTRGGRATTAVRATGTRRIPIGPADPAPWRGTTAAMAAEFTGRGIQRKRRHGDADRPNHHRRLTISNRRLYDRGQQQQQHAQHLVGFDRVQ